MLFTEPLFLFLFLPLLLGLYFACPERYRNPLLSACSLVFFAKGERSFLPWLLASIGVNYCIAVGIAEYRGTPRARQLLALGILSDLLLLAVFKYADFFCLNFNLLGKAVGGFTLPLPRLALPLGISFFTFHKISYKVDVYRNQAVVRRNPLDLALYILLFPQLIAGPIVRYHDIAEQLIRRTVTASDFAVGVRRFILGFGKKMLIANVAAGAADPLFTASPAALSIDAAWLGIICYTIQIYFDFSGYSDMAIGLAQMFGFRFPENFNYPYVATSITDFWRRWHMSLSRWFRDYLYIPLGGNRGGAGRTYLNLLVVFFLCGLWHGASWNFVAWGLYHGGFLVIERLGQGRWLSVLPRPVRHFYTLLVVMVGWVLFRAESMPQALGYVSALFTLGPVNPTGAVYPVAQYLTQELMVVLAIAAIGAAPIVPWLSQWLVRPGVHAPLAAGFRAVLDGLQVVVLLVIFLLSAAQVAAGTYNPFIYFRF